MLRTRSASVTVRIVVMALIGGLTYALCGAADPPAAAGPQTAAEFTADGKLKQPVGYRNWVHVGTPVTPQELNTDEVSEFHTVYIDPESFAHYEKTGEFRDGTVMIKEFSSVASKEASSGTGYFMGEFTGLEASVKDSQRFPDEPGHWAYFNFGLKYPLQQEGSKEAADSCNTCHQDEAASDWVFSQYYPVLRAAAPRSE
jgi:hypothetical protein